MSYDHRQLSMQHKQRTKKTPHTRLLQCALAANVDGSGCTLSEERNPFRRFTVVVPSSVAFIVSWSFVKKRREKTGGGVLAGSSYRALCYRTSTQAISLREGRGVRMIILVHSNGVGC